MARVAFADKDGLTAVVGNETVTAVTLAHECAFHHLRADGVAVVAPLVGREVVIEHELAQHVHREHLSGMCVSLYGLEDVLDVEFCRCVAFHQVKDTLPYLFLCQAACAFRFSFSHVFCFNGSAGSEYKVSGFLVSACRIKE